MSCDPIHTYYCHTETWKKQLRKSFQILHLTTWVDSFSTLFDCNILTDIIKLDLESLRGKLKKRTKYYIYCGLFQLKLSWSVSSGHRFVLFTSFFPLLSSCLLGKQMNERNVCSNLNTCKRCMFVFLYDVEFRIIFFKMGIRWVFNWCHYYKRIAQCNYSNQAKSIQYADVLCTVGASQSIQHRSIHWIKFI